MNRIKVPIGVHHRRFLNLLCDSPLLLGLLLPSWIVFTLGFSFLLGLPVLLWSDEHGADPPVAVTLVILGAVFTFLVCAWGYFLVINYLVFARTTALGAGLHRALRIAQLVAVVVVTFAIAHYYIQLFSADNAYSGIHPIYSDDFPAGRQAVLDKIIHLPSPATVVDLLYFSAVTTATVGYGDMHPTSLVAKSAVMAQVVASFILVVVVLGSVLNGDRT